MGANNPNIFIEYIELRFFHLFVDFPLLAQRTHYWIPAQIKKLATPQSICFFTGSNPFFKA